MGLFFFPVPLDGFVLLFLCLYLQGVRMAWRGVWGGLPGALPRSHPLFQVRGMSTGSKKSQEGDGSDDGVGFLYFTQWRDPGPHPTKRFASPLVA